jgi:hypothetical protein
MFRFNAKRNACSGQYGHASCSASCPAIRFGKYGTIAHAATLNVSGYTWPCHAGFQLMPPSAVAARRRHNSA